MSSETAKFVKQQSESSQSQAAVENACKRLIINLMVHKPDMKSLMVTSCSVGDGATTVVAFLARYLASTMKRILVIDANFDNPALASVFPPKNNISDMASLIPQQTENPKIDLISVGQFATATGRNFESADFKAAFQKLEKDYDMVLVDSASATSCPDTLSLGARVNGVLLVIQAERTRQQVATKATEDLKAVGANVIGAVLNRRMHVIPQSIYRYL